MLKKITSQTSLLLISCLLAIFMQSCYCHYHTVGDGPLGKRDRKTKVFSYKKVYLFNGLIALNPRDGIGIPAGGEKGYQIKTSFNGIDALISYFTFGILTTRTVKIFVKKPPKEKRKTGS